MSNIYIYNSPDIKALLEIKPFKKQKGASVANLVWLRFQTLSDTLDILCKSRKLRSVQSA